ncbi:MAG TPA: hypothetical protein VKX49_26175 [Bryobacteraceae bacterium]|nr:hypothetical protein [Bryobacteraceae bacterium]
MQRLVFVFAVAIAACGQYKPVKLTGEELQTIQKDQAEVDKLKLQLQIAAEPFIAESNAIVSRRCAEAKIEPASCQVDTKTGEISRKEPPKPAKK